MRILFTLFVSLSIAGVHAQDKLYEAASIPEALEKNAFSVKRQEDILFDVRGLDKAYYKVHRVITILNEQGKDQLVFYEFSDKFHSVEDINLSVFNAQGQKLHSYEKSDMLKQSAWEGLVSDGKIYYIMLPVQAYPVTIEENYAIKYNGLLRYPDYEVEVPNQSVEHAVFTAKVPTDLDLRFKKKNTTLDPVINTDGKTRNYTWTVSDMPAIEDEAGAVSEESRFPKVLLAPNQFELDGHGGDMTSWQQFGLWYGELAKDAMNLGPERKQYLQDLVKDAPGDKEKARIIYTWLQHNFRYVSIQLGIGGYKPFEADFVDKKKYGDCKALSNYTQACLNAVGIKSYQALINADYNKEPVDRDFPHNSFNHVILCLPFPTDSVWLDCTSTTNDFGVLGSFTENRNALLITEEGGKLVPTPRSTAAENSFSCNTSVKLSEDGSGTASIRLSGTGEYREEFLEGIADERKDMQKKFLVEELGFLQPDAFDASCDKAAQKVWVKVNMSIEKVPEFSIGSKLFLSPRIYKLWSTDLPKAENRTQDFYFYNPFIKTDTCTYFLPDGYSPETLPQDKQLAFEYGNFTSSHHFNEQEKSITTIIRLELDQYRIPADKYAAARKFFAAVAGEYNEKIVVRKL